MSLFGEVVTVGLETGLVDDVGGEFNISLSRMPA